eukprot:420807_1
MADSFSPLLERPIEEDNLNKLRKCSLICHPISLIGILVLCVIALIFHPFYPNGHSILSITPHPFINTEHINTLHSLDKTFLSREALSDQVSSLPGLDTDINFSHYSGYVDALNGKQIHYWFFEAQENADTAPLFFWTNGGPGCSGLCGLLTEHGPFWAIDNNQLLVNPYSWNTEINIVYFEQPYGVGFSVVDNDLDAVSGDDAAVADFDAAIRSFISKFPIFKDREIYLSSESFGGHYMPLTALEIMKNNQLENMNPKINLAGFMVGNPYTNYYENTIGAIEAFYGHGLMRNDIYETWAHFCFGDETAMDDTHCKMLYMIGYYEADNIDHYALDFDYCEDDMTWNNKGNKVNNHKLKHKLLHRKFISRALNHLLKELKTENEWENYNDKHIRPLFTVINKRKRKGKIRLISRIDALNFKNKIDNYFNSLNNLQERRRLNIEWGYSDAKYYPCAADLMTEYLNQNIVQESLHVKQIEWEMCNNQIFKQWPDSDWDNKMQPYYAEL